MKLEFNIDQYPRWLQLCIGSLLIIFALLAMGTSYSFLIETPSYIHLHGIFKIVAVIGLIVFVLGFVAMIAKGILILFKL
jgi:hypothetical protein